MKASLILAYAIDAVSFLIQKLSDSERNFVEEVVLFGSTARGEADEESDVDLFVKSSRPTRFRARLENLLQEFERSTRYREYWNVLGVSLPISLKVGTASDWAVVPAALREHGLMLFGPYRPPPARGRPVALFTWENVHGTRVRTNLYRRLFGYRRSGRSIPGLLSMIHGERLGKGTVLVPLEHLGVVQKLLRTLKVTCHIRTFSEYESSPHVAAVA